MADSAESTLQAQSVSHQPSTNVPGHEATFVRPSDYLRPTAESRPVTPSIKVEKAEKPIDKAERIALVRY